ncbi:MAG: substrate-binding domain-containing protein [Rhizobiaceae bacterium]|nr:substrate-binding domain-containing protein [Rhizobiaceae bacterium]
MTRNRWINRLSRIGAMLAVVSAGLMFANAASAQDLSPAAQAAKAVAESYMTSEVTWQGPETAPAPKAGSRIAIVSCCQAAEGAARAARTMVEFGDKIGWKMDVMDGRGDPQEQNKAVNAAVDAGYDGIILVFVDTPVVSEGVKRALDAGIKVITLGSLKNTPDTIPDVSWDYAKTGEAIANYMIWKSNGKVNSFILLNTDLYVVRNGQFAGTEAVLSDPAKCPECKMTVAEWSLANIDSQPASLAGAAIQADPTINWVWCFDACMSRVGRSLSASGFTTNDVRGGGFDCHAENLNMIAAGTIQAACAGDPRDWVALATMDNLNRMLNDQPVAEQGIPIRMFDASNLDQMSEEEKQHGWQGGYDFRSKYLELWGVAK